jgi:hypothetical protein
MKRRRFVQTMIAAPAAPALLAQGPVPTGPGAMQRPAVEIPKLETGIADDAGTTVVRFFSPAQLSALHKLGDVILPPSMVRLALRMSRPLHSWTF